MKANLVRIGNSKGIRLPKSVIEQSQLTDELELEVRIGVVVLRAIRAVRKNWAEDAANCREASSKQSHEWDAVVGDFDGDWK